MYLKACTAVKALILGRTNKQRYDDETLKNQTKAKAKDYATLFGPTRLPDRRAILENSAAVVWKV